MYARPGAFGGHVHAHAGAGYAGLEMLELVADAAQAAQAASDDASPDPGSPQGEWLTDDGSPPRDEPAAPPAQPRIVALPPHASAPGTTTERPRPFNLGGAYGAIARINLSDCEEQGLASGYGHVTLTFEESGSPGTVGVDLPQGSASGSRSCVERAFHAVRVAPFDGTQVNVRRVFHVTDTATRSL